MYIERIETLNGDIKDIGGDKFDGQWVYKTKVLISNVTLSTNKAQNIVCSLKDYLPNDGHMYEVIINAWGNTGTASGNRIDVRLFAGSSSTDGTKVFYQYLRSVITRTNSTRYFGGSVILPILPTDQALIMRNTTSTAGTGNKITLNVYGYRRINTNTEGNYLKSISSGNMDIPFGGNNFNGRWTYAYKSLFYAKSFSTCNNIYDISDYLPKDNYVYEVLMEGYSRTGSSAGNSVQFTIRDQATNIGRTTSRIVTRASSSVIDSYNCILPITANRKIKIDVATSGTSGNCALTLRGYRRVGTNI